MLMAQVLRLGEEIGEWYDEPSPVEMADIFIVLAQIVELCNLWDGISEKPVVYPGDTFVSVYGNLCRHMRLQDRPNIKQDVKCMFALCAVGESVIRRKLDKDEKRGRLHGETYGDDTWPDEEV